MRILLLSHGLPPESLGGVEQHVDGLARALVAAGHQVHVVARADLPGQPQGAREDRAGNPAVTRLAYRWEGVDTLAKSYLCAPMADVLRTFLAERSAAGERFDVAHVHHLIGLSTDAVGVLVDAGIPTVLTAHDYWLFCPRGQMFHRREEVCTVAEPTRCAECLGTDLATVHDVQARARDVLARATRLVVPSARALPPFTALGVPAERFTVVENGVDTDRLRELPLPAAGPGPLRIGYFGTIMPSKGLHVLIQALLALPPGAATLRIHGNAVPYHGDQSYPLRCLQRLRPGCGVSYHGPYGLDELPTLLAGIDVLAAPALWHESFGLTVREALAAARPVLVSRIGGLQDAVQDGQEGLVLPPGDVPAWTAALAALAGDRARVRRMASAARSRARGFAAMAEDLLRVYTAAKDPAPAHRTA